MLNNKVVVSVQSRDGNKVQVPYSFPWHYGVRCSLLGDVNDLDNLRTELSEIRKLVLQDMNRYHLTLRYYKIVIDNSE